MKRPNQYDWLIIAEGNSDISIYNEYLRTDKALLSFKILGVGGKGFSLNMEAWDKKHLDTVQNELGRVGFRGVILVVDADDISGDQFANYRRSNNIHFVGNIPPPSIDPTGTYWLLDNMKGIDKPLPIKGIVVPKIGNGCLETELIAAYGFPVEQQPEYSLFTGIIKQATTAWKIPKNKDGKLWWDINEKAKIDKFIYAALRQGFKVCEKEPTLPREPNIISRLRTAMTDDYCFSSLTVYFELDVPTP